MAMIGVCVLVFAGGCAKQAKADAEIQMPRRKPSTYQSAYTNEAVKGLQVRAALDKSDQRTADAHQNRNGVRSEDTER